jgi:hypothetical protein
MLMFSTNTVEATTMIFRWALWDKEKAM